MKFKEVTLPADPDPCAAVRSFLDEEYGTTGWAVKYGLLAAEVYTCTMSVLGATRVVVIDFNQDPELLQTPEAKFERLFCKAAGQFGVTIEAAVENSAPRKTRKPQKERAVEAGAAGLKEEVPQFEPAPEPTPAEEEAAEPVVEEAPIDQQPEEPEQAPHPEPMETEVPEENGGDDQSKETEFVPAARIPEGKAIWKDVTHVKVPEDEAEAKKMIARLIGNKSSLLDKLSKDYDAELKNGHDNFKLMDLRKRISTLKGALALAKERLRKLNGVGTDEPAAPAEPEEAPNSELADKVSETMARLGETLPEDPNGERQAEPEEEKPAAPPAAESAREPEPEKKSAAESGIEHEPQPGDPDFDPFSQGATETFAQAAADTADLTPAGYIRQDVPLDAKLEELGEFLGTQTAAPAAVPESSTAVMEPGPDGEAEAEYEMSGPVYCKCGRPLSYAVLQKCRATGIDPPSHPECMEGL